MTGKGKHCLCSRAFLFPLQKGNELEEGVTSEGKQRCPWLWAIPRLVLR